MISENRFLLLLYKELFAVLAVHVLLSIMKSPFYNITENWKLWSRNPVIKFSVHSININRNLKYYFSALEVMITFQIFANTFHSAALCDTGYLITFWIKYLNHTRKENWTSRESVHFYVFYIASLWWCIVHWCKDTRFIYRESKHICLLVITFATIGAFDVRFCSWISP